MAMLLVKRGADPYYEYQIYDIREDPTVIWVFSTTPRQLAYEHNMEELVNLIDKDKGDQLSTLPSGQSDFSMAKKASTIPKHLKKNKYGKNPLVKFKIPLLKTLRDEQFLPKITTRNVTRIHSQNMSRLPPELSMIRSKTFPLITGERKIERNVTQIENCRGEMFQIKGKTPREEMRVSTERISSFSQETDASLYSHMETLIRKTAKFVPFYYWNKAYLMRRAQGGFLEKSLTFYL